MRLLLAIIGNAEELRDKLEPFLDTGAQHLTIYDFTGVLAVPPEVTASELEKLVSSLRHSHPSAGLGGLVDESGALTVD